MILYAAGHAGGTSPFSYGGDQLAQCACRDPRLLDMTCLLEESSAESSAGNVEVSWCFFVGRVCWGVELNKF